MQPLRLAAMIALWGLVAAAPPAPARAQTVIDEWATVKLPPPPTLKPVTLAAKEAALLVMDLHARPARRSAGCAAPTRCPRSQGSSPRRAPGARS